jgi:protein-S-isoprenylcysteine O-methyltransferase Ste14
MDPLPYFVSASVLLGASVVVFRFLVRRDYRRGGRLAPTSTLLEWVIFFGWGFFTWADWPPEFPHPDMGPDARELCYVFIVFGMLGMFGGIAYLGFLRSNGLELGVLKRSGPYRVSRNPQVVACTLAVIGYGLLWPSWHTSGWFLLFVVPAHMMVLAEEENLRRVFGEAYEQYCRETPRYLGLPRA